MAEVGTVYVQVMPSTKGFAKALGTQGGAGGAAAGKAFSASFGKIVGGSAIGNILSNVVSKVTGTISASMGAAVSRVDTIANYPKVMENLGYGADAAKASIETLSAGIDGMPTSLDGIVSMTQQLAPMCGGLEKATSLSLAMNNMMLASGASTADQSRAMQQYSQMLARGKVELNDWRTLQEVMPGQLNQVAQAMLGAGKNSTDLYNALKTGKVKMADFNKTVEELNVKGVGNFASFEEQARAATEGIGTAMDNMRNRTAKAIAKVIDHIGQGTISGAINRFTSSFSGIADTVIVVMDAIASKVDFAGFEAAFKGIGDALAEVFSQGDTAVSFGEGIGNMINMLIPAIQAATPIIQLLATLFKFCAENAGILIPTLAILAVVVFGIKTALNCAPLMEKFTGGLTKMKPVVAANVPQLLSLAVAAIGLGVGITLAAAGVYVLVQAAIQLVNAGPMAALALVGLVAVIAILAVGAAALGPALTASSVGLIAFGAAVLMICVGIAIVVAAFALLAMQLPLIATYGLQTAVGILAIGAAMIVFAVAAALAGVGMVLAAVGLALLGAAALAAAVGVGVFGAAILVAGIGILLAAVGVAVLAAAIGILAAGVTSTADGLMQMGEALPAIASNAPGAAAALGALAAASGGAALGIGASAGPLAGLAGSAGAAAAAVMALNAGFMLSFAAAFMLAVAISSASGAINGASGVFSGGCASMAGSFDQIRNNAESAMAGAVAAVQSAAARINGTVMTARVEVQIGPLPHFSMTGKFDTATGAVPSIGVNWYGNGAIFKRPSVIGVGEAGTEVVENVDRLDGRIRKAVRAESDSNRGPTQNFNIYTNDPELVAAKVAARQRRAH